MYRDDEIVQFALSRSETDREISGREGGGERDKSGHIFRRTCVVMTRTADSLCVRQAVLSVQTSAQTYTPSWNTSRFIDLKWFKSCVNSACYPFEYYIEFS